MTNVTGVAISHDNGKSFTRYGDIRADVALWEPNAIEVEDGHVVLYCRAGKPELMISESFDYGKTWSEPVLSGIPNPDTKVTLVKARGQILMINNFDRETRKNLCIARSTDGKTFETVIAVAEEDKRRFYPHAIADDGAEKLYVAYENGKKHWLKVFTYDELGI